MPSNQTKPQVHSALVVAPVMFPLRSQMDLFEIMMKMIVND